MNIKTLSISIAFILSTTLICVGCSENKPKFNASNSGGEFSSGVTASPVPQPPPLVLPATASPAVPGPAASGSADPPAPPKGGALSFEDLSIDGSPCKVNGRLKLQAHFMGTPLGSDRLLIGRLCVNEGQAWKAIDRDKYAPLNGPSTVIAKGDKNFGYVDSSKNTAPDGNVGDRHDRLTDVFGRETITVVAWENGHEVPYDLYKPEIVYIEDSSDSHVRGICSLANKPGAPDWYKDVKKKCSVGDYSGAQQTFKAWATREDLQAEIAARKAGEAKGGGSKEPAPVGYNPSAP